MSLTPLHRPCGDGGCCAEHDEHGHDAAAASWGAWCQGLSSMTRGRGVFGRGVRRGAVARASGAGCLSAALFLVREMFIWTPPAFVFAPVWLLRLGIPRLIDGRRRWRWQPACPHHRCRWCTHGGVCFGSATRVGGELNRTCRADHLYALRAAPARSGVWPHSPHVGQGTYIVALTIPTRDALSEVAVGARRLFVEFGQR